MWSPVPANPVSFIGYKPDQALTAALAGSQVALHEHRLAYENLLAAFTKDRGGWEQQKGSLVRSMQHANIVVAHRPPYSCTTHVLCAGRRTKFVSYQYGMPRLNVG